eukprot:ANDGO_02781.mRNA.1 Vacuolar protein sorting-associated protein 27
MTTVASAVEKATSELLIEPDWPLNLQICDVVNNNPDLAKDFMKNIRKRLTHKNQQVQLLALTLLETVMKNCGPAVYVEVGSKDFQKDLVSVLQKERKKGVISDVQDKILFLIVQWNECFEPLKLQYPGFCDTYKAVRDLGFGFPPVNSQDLFEVRSVAVSNPRLSSSSAASYPAQHASYGGAQPQQPPGVLFDAYGRAVVTGQQHPVHPQTHAQPQPQPQQPYSAAGYGAQPPMQRTQDPQVAAAKLKKDLSMVSENAGVLIDVLQAVEPGDDVRSNELVQELVRNVRAMQPRMISLLETVSDDATLAEILVCNDEVNRALDKYERMSGDVAARAGEPASVPASAPSHGSPPRSSNGSANTAASATGFVGNAATPGTVLLDFNDAPAAAGPTSSSSSSRTSASTANRADMTPSQLLDSMTLAESTAPAAGFATAAAAASSASPSHSISTGGRAANNSNGGTVGDDDGEDMFGQIARRSQSRPQHSGSAGPASSSPSIPSPAPRAPAPLPADFEDEFEVLARRGSGASSSSNTAPAPALARAPASSSTGASAMPADDDFDSFLNARLLQQQQQGNVRTVDSKQQQKMEKTSDDLFQL